MRLSRIATAAAVLLVCCRALPASAQAVKLEFHDGNVSLATQNAPLRTVLNEWARLGGTQLINADKVPGSPVTLQLTDVPETRALDILLRGSAGYIVSQRAVAASPSQSQLDRILIVPTAGTAAVQARPAATPPPFSVPQFQQPPRDPDDDPVSDVPPDDDQPTRNRPPNPPGGRQAPPQPFQPGDDDRPEPPQPATPANPFGVQPGSARPGVITPVPQQPQRPRSQPDPEP